MNNSFYFAPPFSFELAVGEGIAWVPLADLGVSQWTQNEYANIFKLPPEQKISLSFTAIDIVELLFHGHFCEVNDCILHSENGIIWEHHKPGFISVKTNCGCCASIASYFTYLYNHCDEKGYITFVRENGSGHALVYIKRNPFIYYIDPILYLSEYRKNLIPETGLRKDTANARFITGGCLRAKSFQSFIRYFNRFYRYSSKSHVICKCTGECVPPISVTISDSKCYIYHPIDMTELLYCNESKFQYTTIASPTWTPIWE